jgi:hypothetical protein
MRRGQIGSVTPLPDVSDDESVDNAYRLFATVKDTYDGFELWHRTRLITRLSVAGTGAHVRLIN